MRQKVLTHLLACLDCFVFTRASALVLHLLEPTLHRGSSGCQDNVFPPSENTWKEREAKGSEAKGSGKKLGRG